MRKIAAATSPDVRFQLSTDGFAPYNYAVGMELGDRCTYGQIVKVYKSPTMEEQRRYSLPTVSAVEKTEVYGDPDFDLICTSHIERQNGSRWENLRAALALHFAYYNFCRVHRTLKMTPAMAAGITDRV